MGIGEIFSGIGLGNIGESVMGIVVIILVVGLGVAIMGGIFYFFYKRKNYNLLIEFKLPRNVRYVDGKPDINNATGFIVSEWGKGNYNVKRGVVFVKRKGRKKTAMKPFNVQKYLQGTNTLTVVQIGADEYKPVIPQSYLLYEDEENGEDCALLKLKTDTTQSKAWKNTFERDAKQTFSIMNLLREYAPYITIGLVIFLWGIQVLLLYTKK